MEVIAELGETKWERGKGLYALSEKEWHRVTMHQVCSAITSK